MSRRKKISQSLKAYHRRLKKNRKKYNEWRKKISIGLKRYYKYGKRLENKGIIKGISKKVEKSFSQKGYQVANFILNIKDNKGRKLKPIKISLKLPRERRYWIDEVKKQIVKELNQKGLYLKKKEIGEEIRTHKIKTKILERLGFRNIKELRIKDLKIISLKKWEKGI